MNGIAQSYFEGIITKCAEYGVDPEWLVKNAFPASTAPRVLEDVVSKVIPATGRKLKMKSGLRFNRAKGLHFAGPKVTPELTPKAREVLHVPRAGEPVPAAEIPETIADTAVPHGSTYGGDKYNPAAEKAKEIAEGGAAGGMTEGGASVAATGPKITTRRNVPMPGSGTVNPTAPMLPEATVKGTGAIKDPTAAAAEAATAAGGKEPGLSNLASLGILGGAGYGTYKGLDYLGGNPEVKNVLSGADDAVQEVSNYFKGRPSGWRPKPKDNTWGRQ